MDKQILVYAVVGRGFNSYKEAENYTRLGFARFTGNQHNPEWEWKRGVLESFSEQDLLDLVQRPL